MSLKAFSIEHLPPNGVEVTDGEVVSMRNSTGGDPHPGHAVVSGDPAAIQGVNLQSATTAFVDDGDVVSIQTSDGSADLAISPAAVASGELDGIWLNAALAVIQDGIGNFDVTDYGAGGGAVAVIARVANNAPSVQLANSTTKIAINAAPVQVTAGGKTVGATIAVDQGLWQSFPLSATTDAIVSNGDGVTVRSQVSNATPSLTVSAGVLQDINLAPTAAIITTGTSATVKINGGGADVPGALILLTPAGAIDQVQLPQGVGFVENGVPMNVPVTGAYNSAITAQLDASGVITGFTLS